MDKEKIIEIIVDELKKLGYQVTKEKNMKDKDITGYKSGFFTQSKYIQSYTSLPKGRQLITEFEIKQILKQNPNAKEIIIPKNAILGPLAEDFINSRGIKIKRE